jgi:hypothetical protein
MPLRLVAPVAGVHQRVVLAAVVRPLVDQLVLVVGQLLVVRVALVGVVRQQVVPVVLVEVQPLVDQVAQVGAVHRRVARAVLAGGV